MGLGKWGNNPISQYCRIARYFIEAKPDDAFQLMKEVHKKYAERKILQYDDSLQERGLFGAPSNKQVSKIMNDTTKRQEYSFCNGRRRVLGKIDDNCFIFYVGDTVAK